MKRRRLIRYAAAGTITSLGLDFLSRQGVGLAQDAGNTLTIESLGHTCFRFTGGGVRILVNPFRRIGCTRYFAPAVAEADLVLISSRLFDEGYLQELVENDLLTGEDDSRVLSAARDYTFDSVSLTGSAVPHDRVGGRRFGQNIIWRWRQAGVSVVHMGGAAAPLGATAQTLFNRPDLLFVPVGGGPKAYGPAEAVQAVQTLKPKIVVPTHYATAGADAAQCDIGPLEEFLSLMGDTPITRAPDGRLAVRPDQLPDSGMRIQVYDAPVVPPEPASPEPASSEPASSETTPPPPATPES